MWELNPCVDFEKRLKKYSKRHRQETLNALSNLESYLKALRSGLNPQQIIRTWVHSEPKGIKAFDETGPKNPQKAIRLYVYPEESAELLHVMTLGDKDQQSEDIKQCEHYVEQLRNKPQPHPPKETEGHDQANQKAAG